MPPIAMAFGLMLILVGAVGYYSAEPEKQSWTALIPAFVGGGLLLLAALGLKEQLRKHAMHAAAAVGLLGFLAAAGRMAATLARGTFVWGAPAISQTLMAVLCGLFVALCVKSFIDARRAQARRAEESRGASAS